MYSKSSRLISNAVFWPTGGQSHTKYHREDLPAEVEVVRRHHPLAGRTFQVLRAGRTFLVLQVDDGSHFKIPKGWTSLAYESANDPLLQDSVFTTASISALLELIQLLSTR